MRSARKIVRAAHRAGVEVLTLFAFSQENWRRPPEEVSLLMQLFIKLRAEARASKNFALADGIRKGLTEIGVTLEDRADGTIWRQE